ncbi:hypothetical protein ACJZ2D_004812 [Fusarium nematophilum]
MRNMAMNLDILKMLIAYGANVNEGYALNIVCDVCSSSLESESELADYKTARELLLQAGADPSLYSEAKQNGEPKQKREPLKSTRTELQSAAYNNDLDRVRCLISNSEDVNEPAAHDRGATALQYAAMMGHFDMTVILLENGAAINTPGAEINGRTALQGAAEHGRLDIVHLLLESDDELGL